LLLKGLNMCIACLKIDAFLARPSYVEDKLQTAEFDIYR